MKDNYHTQSEIIEFLKSKRQYLEQHFGVKKIGLFGSYARRGRVNKGDIDILVELKEPKYTYWAGLKIYLEENFDNNIDLITKASHLSQRFLNRIKKDIIYV